MGSARGVVVQHAVVNMVCGTGAATTTTTTDAFSSSDKPYTPVSAARARILLLLLDAGGGPLTTAAFYQELNDCSQWCVRKALSWLWQRGVLRRLGRGLYALEPAYLQFLSELRPALEQIVSQSCNIFTGKTSDTKVKKMTSLSPSVTNLKESVLSEKVKQFVKQRYGNELDRTDYLVVETLARKYEETGSWYIEDYEGLGLAEQVRGWAKRLGLCRSSSNNSSSIGAGCPSLGEIADSLKKLADLDIVYLHRRFRKMRLNRYLLARCGCQ